MADPVTALPEESRELSAGPRPRALRLLRRHDFRNLFLAVSASELGDSLHYIALMWVALETGGPLGVVAVRLADSVPALLFGLHGGLVADRWDRRSVMISRRSRSRPDARADRNRRSLRPPPSLGAGRRRLRARGRDELLRAGLRRARAVARRPPQRAAGERARPGLGPGALDRRLGARGRAPGSATDLDVLRDQRGLVLPLGAADRPDRTSSYVAPARGGDRDPRRLRRSPAAPDARRGRHRTRSRGDGLRRHVDRRSADLRPRPPARGCRRVLDRDGRLCGRGDPERGAPRPQAGAPKGARESRRLDALSPRLRTDRPRRLAVGGRRGRLHRGVRAELGVRPARVGSAGGRPGRVAGPGARVDLARPSGRARHGLLLVAPLFAVLAPQAVFAGAAVALAFVGIAGAGAALVVSSRRAA